MDYESGFMGMCTCTDMDVHMDFHDVPWSSGKRCLCSDKYIAKHLEFGTGDSKMKGLRETAELNRNEGAPKSKV